MSGPPPSYYLSPPDSAQAPAYEGPGFAAPQEKVIPPAVWVDPTAPAHVNPLIAFAMGTGTGSVLFDQFTGPAAWSIVMGLLSIGLPYFTPFYFRFMPIFGFIAGVRAVLSGRLIGGLVGIGLNAIAGFFTLFFMGVLR